MRCDISGLTRAASTKSDIIELQTAINSMFRWYRDAKRCYIYLADVSNNSVSGMRQNILPWEAAFRKSRWFTRGWTLQEHLAPKKVGFCSKEGTWLGDKRLLESLIRDITSVSASAFRGTPLSDFPVWEREAWVRRRQTKYGVFAAGDIQCLFAADLRRRAR
ncbi:hypothetical protein BKA67DRAFT_118315 [Truncatella angustata]|uniref:Heterokaryon incompatibility domain-containing protein n=1 Tax=Truncatella angustata TaxID=152316 RepID=A0A9P8UB63_9PEZI|nr:uncharacterized protein BKA67DRAFT_118315 [Truncatella angustata]KAH6645587.1 hypothetical protein BKA67DRAFT_118315 [Truncatella angustata]